MTDRIPSRVTRWSCAAALLILAAAPAAATCEQVQNLLAQGHSFAEIAAAMNAPVGAVQACVQPRPSNVRPANRSFSAAGPAPIGAAGPAPIGAAGPAPLGAAGPAPLGAAGPAPFGAGGGSTTVNQSKPAKAAP